MKILLAEGDQKAADSIRSGLIENGHTVDWLTDGREVLTYCLSNQCDVAIIDRMIPGMDGLSVIHALRATTSKPPVIFLTAPGHVDDKVEGLRAGGDDYMVKPFSFSELLARITALYRRRHETIVPTELKVHDLSLDLLARTATRGDALIELKQKEFSLLELLMKNADRVVTRTMIFETIWGFDFNPGTSVVETHISNLRRKIDKPFDTALIQTVRNAGYTIHAPR